MFLIRLIFIFNVFCFQMPTHVDKERVRYFQDDDSMNLKDLVKNEKMRTAEDQNSLFMRMASKVRCSLYDFLIKHIIIRSIREDVRPE